MEAPNDEQVLTVTQRTSRECGSTCVIEGRPVKNFAQTNFLGMQEREDVRIAAKIAIEKYGCGSCGPRGFYGTIDVHLELEEKIAAFMKTDESILYSYDLATAASTIPAFCKRGDAIVCDQACNWGIKNGCTLSRSAVRYFQHNDMEDLETKLKEIVEEGKASGRKKLNKRFIVVEGICSQNGDLTRLDKIMELKEKYKFRILVDESLSFGVLGQTGRGAAEHFGIDPSRIEIITASLGNTLGSVGGFCCGTNEVVDHQRLSGVGYCFSASLPPYLAAAGVAALQALQNSREALMERLKENIAALRMHFLNIHPKLRLSGDPLSPLAFLHLEEQGMTNEEKQEKLQHICDVLLSNHNILLVVNKFSHLDKKHGASSLKIAVTSSHTIQDITYTAASLRAVAREVLSM